MEQVIGELSRQPKSQAQIGQERFTGASGKCPASVAAQAADIARECRLNNLGDPYYLGHAFLADSDQVALAVKFGNNAHSAHSARTDEELLPVTEEDVRFYAAAAFATASERFMSTPLDKLEIITGELYSMFPHHSKQDETRFSAEVAKYLRTYQLPQISQQQQAS